MVPELTADISTLAAPGSLLKQKRIGLGWPVEKVAGSLLLSVSQIEAIERDDYASLSGATYVLGYWRSYSGLLGLDIEESIDLHKAQLRNPLSAITLEANHQKAQGHQEKNRKRSAFLFLVLSGLFLSVIWIWQNPEDNPFNQWVDNLSNTRLAKLTPQGDGLQVIGSDASSLKTEGSQVEQSVILPEPNFSDDYVRTEQSTGQVVATTEVLDGVDGLSESDSAQAQLKSVLQTTDGSLLSDELGEVDADAVEDSLRITQETTTSLVTVQDEEADVLSQGSAKPLVSIVEEENRVNDNNSAQDGLVVIGQSTEKALDGLSESNGSPDGAEVNTGNVLLSPDNSTVVSGSTSIGSASSEPDNGTPETFDPLSPHNVELLVETETWIDVRDVTGEKLVYQTVESGQRLKLRGEPPFYVFIGTSSGVSVNYLGEPVAFKTHSSGLFARFKIGELQE
ncbi:MAG: DUF4115 domain-containing protein [Gammaproteobacteria bacterium]|nr:DUF4115 domain-containing protein [Gammaproteobacteria bacterium]